MKLELNKFIYPTVSSNHLENYVFCSDFYFFVCFRLKFKICNPSVCSGFQILNINLKRTKKIKNPGQKTYFPASINTYINIYCIKR